MRKRNFIALALLTPLSRLAHACVCGWGEYFYSMEKLEGQAVEPEQYYQANYGVTSLKNIHKGTLNPRVEDSAGFMVITLPIPEEYRGQIFHFVLESKVTLEAEPNKGFADKSTFETVIFKPSTEILELQTRMSSKGNEWLVYILALKNEGEIVASATHTGKDTCGKDVYVSSIERAKELDSKRTSGCFQTWGYK